MLLSMHALVSFGAAALLGVKLVGLLKGNEILVHILYAR